MVESGLGSLLKAECRETLRCVTTTRAHRVVLQSAMPDTPTAHSATQNSQSPGTPTAPRPSLPPRGPTNRVRGGIATRSHAGPPSVTFLTPAPHRTGPEPQTPLPEVHASSSLGHNL